MPEKISIRQLDPKEAPQLFQMRDALWPGDSPEQHIQELAQYLNHPEASQIFVASDGQGVLYGFLEITQKKEAPGCQSSPVGFVEGWFVVPSKRGQGLGRQLMEAACAWARDKGLKEIASDALLDNRGGQAAHGALDFKEVERTVAFRREL